MGAVTHEHALLLTLTIEGVVGGALLYAWVGLRKGVFLRGLMIVMAASLLTHPAAWQANRIWLVHLPFPTRATIIELSVALAETVVLRVGLSRVTDEAAGPVPWMRCLVVSFVMNGASFGYGLLRLL